MTFISILLLQRDGEESDEVITVSVLHEGHDPKIIWQLGQSSAEKGAWVQGRVEVTPIEAANKPYQVRSDLSKKITFLIFFLQIVVTSHNDQNAQSFVAMDQFEFLQTPVCELQPSAAKPTPAPTEPPGRK